MIRLFLLILGFSLPAFAEAPRLFVATKAFVNYQGKVLLVRESKRYGEGTNTGYFDVIGGRVNPGETWQECLLREIKEETGLDVAIGKPFFIGEWRPVVKGEPWQVIGIFIECFASSDQVVLSQDHDAYQWIDPREYKNVSLIPSGNGRQGLDDVFASYLMQ